MEAARNLLWGHLLFLWSLRLGLTLCLRNQALGHLHMLFVRLHVLVSLGSMCGQRMKHGACIQKRNMHRKKIKKIQAILKPRNSSQHPLHWLSICITTKSRQSLAALSYAFGGFTDHAHKLGLWLKRFKLRSNTGASATCFSSCMYPCRQELGDVRVVRYNCLQRWSLGFTQANDGLPALKC